jgi:toxin ParE1/3/4
MKMFWALQAQADRLAISEFIAQDNPEAAAALDERFMAAAAQLSDFPKLGHPGTKRGTREWAAHHNYRLVYRIKRNQVEVLAVVHARRNWPD